MRTSRSLSFVATILVSLLLHASSGASKSTFAQDLDNASITGRVIDQNRAVITNATITATLIKSGFSRTVTTDSSGLFKLHYLEPGTYLLRVCAEGFAVQEKPALSLIAVSYTHLTLPTSDLV